VAQLNAEKSIEMMNRNERSNAANILLFLGIGLSTFGIILISTLGRTSYIFIGTGLLLFVKWFGKTDFTGDPAPINYSVVKVSGG
jgi:hypothetical protein